MHYIENVNEEGKKSEKLFFSKQYSDLYTQSHEFQEKFLCYGLKGHNFIPIYFADAYFETTFIKEVLTNKSGYRKTSVFIYSTLKMMEAV